MESDREKWDRKYAEYEGNPGTADTFLMERCHILKGKTILDLACGDGRNSVFLALQGFEVTCVDISQNGLNRLNTFSEEIAERENETINIKTICADLDDESFLKSLSVFDNIIISRYRPCEDLWTETLNHLSPNGVFLFWTFNEIQHKEKGFPLKYCVKEDEYKNPEGDLTLENYIQFEENKDYMDGYVFRKCCV